MRFRLFPVLAALVAAALLAGSAPAQVLPGIEVALRDGFGPLTGKRVGLITNHTAVDRQGRHIVDLLHARTDIKLVALFAPEHGIRGDKDELVKDGVDAKTGIPVYSLYGTRYRPTEESLKGVEGLIFDIQDIGARYYTYPATMKICMQEAAKHKIPFMVLDRPNPINGRDMDGPNMDPRFMGFASWAPVPTRHGMTVGELARYFNEHFKINCDLTVVKVEGWKRDMWFDKTGLPWVNPSPNIRNLTEATLYSGIGALEATNISVGRGTEEPFEVLGAPWMDSQKLLVELNRRTIPGLRFETVEFIPKFREFKGQICRGVRMTMTDRDALRPVAAAVEIADAIYQVHGNQFILKGTRGMFGKADVPESIEKRQSPKAITARWKKDLSSFEGERKKYLLYD